MEAQVVKDTTAVATASTTLSITGKDDSTAASDAVATRDHSSATDTNTTNTTTNIADTSEDAIVAATATTNEPRVKRRRVGENVNNADDGANRGAEKVDDGGDNGSEGDGDAAVANEVAIPAIVINANGNSDEDAEDHHDGDDRRDEDGEGGEEEKNEEEEVDEGNDGDDDDDDDSEGVGGALEGLSLDDFVRIMGDAVANEEAIPQEHNRTRRERKQYLGGLINADPATTSELRHELGTAFFHRFGQPTFSAEQAAFVFRRIRDLNGDANNISRLLSQLHQTTRLRPLMVIYNHPDPARRFRVRATVADQRLTMSSTVHEVLQIMRDLYTHPTHPNIPPLLELYGDATEFSVQLEGQRVVVVNRLRDVRLYELIREIANIQPGILSLEIVPRFLPTL